MKLTEVKDGVISDLTGIRYDLAVFASGNEERATWLASQLDSRLLDTKAVLGFSEGETEERRISNDQIFRRLLGVDPIKLSTDEESEVRYLIDECIRRNRGKDTIRVLVDYSCMSRSWYGAILAMMRHIATESLIVIDFCYSVGTYEDKFEDGSISRIAAVDGFEGTSYDGDGSLSVIGLGFHANASLCVVDQLESDQLLPVIADPAHIQEYVDTVMRKNADLIADPKSLSLLRLPCLSVRVTYEFLIESLSPYLGSLQIALVAMGPKTHALAFLLTALRFPEISCLRVSLKHSDRRNVKAIGVASVTRLLFSPGTIDLRSNI